MSAASAPAPPGLDTGRRRFGRLGLAGVIYTYALVVYGGIVRITGSGLGCGDHWPDCNGSLAPRLDLPTFIELSHRVLAAGLSLLTLWVVILAWRHRKDPAVRGRGGMARPAYLAGLLIVVQVLLGAITVKLDLSAAVTALHFMTALALLAAFASMAVRGGMFDNGLAALHSHEGRLAPVALIAAGLGFIVITFGALTANVGMSGPLPPSGAAMACQGFPLCNGSLLPAGNSWVDIQWTHRMLAYLLFFDVLVAGVITLRRSAPRTIANFARASMGLVVLQVLVAAGLVLMHLPPAFQATHLAVGAALWACLTFWAALARRLEARTLSFTR
ncbi:MAG: COX15/CtaA family protein [Gemmatimonadota bacterium]